MSTAALVLWIALTVIVSLGVVYDRWLRDWFLTSFAPSEPAPAPSTPRTTVDAPSEQPNNAPTTSDATLQVAADIIAYCLNNNIPLTGHVTAIKRIVVGANAETYMTLTKLVDDRVQRKPSTGRTITVNDHVNGARVLSLDD